MTNVRSWKQISKPAATIGGQSELQAAVSTKAVWWDLRLTSLLTHLFYLLLFLPFFLAYSQPLQIGCLSYFHTWCGLSANLGCRSETCCTQLDGNAELKKLPKIRHLGTIAQLCN